MPTRATVPVCTVGARVAVVSDFPAQNPAAARRIAAAPRFIRFLFRVVMNGSSVRLAACAGYRRERSGPGGVACYGGVAGWGVVRAPCVAGAPLGVSLPRKTCH